MAYYLNHYWTLSRINRHLTCCQS